MAKSERVLKAADLYCGAGGFSEGLEEACQRLGFRLWLVAINHWGDAIETHKRNHPEAIQLCEDLDSVDPRKIVAGGKLDLLIASPECVHHSRARGGKPRNNQSRMQPWSVVRWASSIYVSALLIENVTEFVDWGPLDSKGHPIERLKGQEFRAWIAALEALNYRVEWRNLNAMNFGAATSRERFFLIAHKGAQRIVWPEPTHGNTDEHQPRLFGVVKPVRTAREIIDWSLPGTSIFGRRKPLSDATLRRIEAGLRKFCGIEFILPNEGFYRGNSPRSVDEPIPSPTAARGAGNLVQPIVVQLNGKQSNTAYPVDRPLNAVVGSGNHFAVTEPFLMRWDYSIPGKAEGNAVYPLDRPVPTLHTKQSFGLVQTETTQVATADGFVLNVRGGKDGYTRGDSFDAPLQTITAQNPMGSVLVKLLHEGSDAVSITRPVPVITSAQDLALAQSFLVKYYQGSDAVPVDQPVPAVTANYEHLGLVNAFLVLYHGASYPGGERVASLNCPLPVVATSNQHGFVLPLLVKYYGNGVGQSVDEPLGTVTGKDHFGLVLASLDGTQWLFDILFRMLEPHELAAAMGFRPGYFFFGTGKKECPVIQRGAYKFQGPKKPIVKMIGNAVENNIATALCEAAIKMTKG